MYAQLTLEWYRKSYYLLLVSWKIVLRIRNAVFEIRGRVFNRCNRFILCSPLEAAAAWSSMRCLARRCCHWKYFSKIVS